MCRIDARTSTRRTQGGSPERVGPPGRRIRGTRTAGALLLSSICAGCFFPRVGTPRGSLPTEEAASFAYGGWITLELYAGDQVSGELIAVGADSVYVLRAGTAELTAYPLLAILEAELVAYGPNTGGVGGWALLGTLGTASHGYYLLFSMPAWAITGSVATLSAARAGRIKHEFPDLDWRQFVPWAQFPQGLPRDLDRGSLTHAPATPP